MPFVLILVIWYISEWRKKKSLSPAQLERLKSLEPKKLDKYDLIMLVMFGVLVGAFALGIAFDRIELLIFASILVPILGLMVLFAFAHGMSAVTRRRQEVEIDALGFPPADRKQVARAQRAQFSKEVIIIFMIITVVVAVFFVMPLPPQPLNINAIIVVVIIEVLLFAFYYYFSKQGGSKNE